jgi:uncharacterized Ntn-hydrolase superfamily protein
MTCSIIARCSHTGQFGIAAATAVPAVGKLLTHASPGVGAIATQARLNPYLGIDGMRLLEQGFKAQPALEQLINNDPRAENRQLAIIDRDGDTAVWNGSGCLDYCNGENHDGFTVQGNRLVGQAVLDAMAEAYAARPELSLDERLFEALEAAVAAGGDLEGEVSATIYIVDTEEYPLWDIRVDEHADPVMELRRLHDVFAEKVLPEIRCMPTRTNPGGTSDSETQV